MRGIASKMREIAFDAVRLFCLLLNIWYAPDDHHIIVVLVFFYWGCSVAYVVVFAEYGLNVTERLKKLKNGGNSLLFCGVRDWECVFAV